MSSPDSAAGNQPLDAGASDFNAISYLVRQALSSTRTTTLVRVVSCTNSGGLSAVGFVDVQVLVQRVDGAANIIDAGMVYNIPYVRLQGGDNAVIMDPQPGDIGLAMISDRDISTIKESRQPAAPASARHHNMADALYIGGILNGVPTQYVQFAADGIHLVSPTKVTVQAPNVEIDGSVAIFGAVLTHNGVNVGSTHKHVGVTPGSGVSGLPQ